MLSNLVVLVVVGVLFSGCLGLGGNKIKDQTVEEFFEEVSATIKSMDAGRIADLWHYPLIWSYGTWDREETQGRISDFLESFHEDERIEAWDIVDDPESGEIEVAISSENRSPPSKGHYGKSREKDHKLRQRSSPVC